MGPQDNGPVIDQVQEQVQVEVAVCLPSLLPDPKRIYGWEPMTNKDLQPTLCLGQLWHLQWQHLPTLPMRRQMALEVCVGLQLWNECLFHLISLK